MTDIHKIPFDYCLDINSWQLNFFDLFDNLNLKIWPWSFDRHFFFTINAPN